MGQLSPSGTASREDTNQSETQSGHCDNHLHDDLLFVCLFVVVAVVAAAASVVPILCCRSAGANLRRYNEAALISEVRDLLNSWSAHINESCCVFVRLPKHSRGVLIGERGDSRTPLQRGDPRLRPIPFPTRRPTLKEVRATHARLAAVYVGVVGGEGPGRPASGKKKGISPVKSGVAASQGKALGAGLPNKGPHPCTLPGSAGSALRSDPDTTTTTVIDVDGTPDATDTTSAQVSSAKTKKRKKDKKKPTAPPPPPPPPPPLQGVFVCVCVCCVCVCDV